MLLKADGHVFTLANIEPAGRVLEDIHLIKGTHGLEKQKVRRWWPPDLKLGAGAGFEPAIPRPRDY